MKNQGFIHHPQPIHQTQTRLLNQAQDAHGICHFLHAVIHDMIATLLHPGRFSIDLQSQGDLRLKKRMEATYLLFVRLHFFFPPEASVIPSLPLSVSEELPHDVYQKEVNFQNVTFASN